MQLISNAQDVMTRSYSFLISLGLALLSSGQVLGQMWVLGLPWYAKENLVAIFTALAGFAAAGLRLVDQGLSKTPATDDTDEAGA